MKNLQLSLKGKWFQMTKEGVKTEDYRDITQYWVKRLVNFHKEEMTREDFITYINGGYDSHNYSDFISFKRFDKNIMTLGYPKKTDTNRILILEHGGVEIRTGNPNWGAEPGKLYFVIKHGSIVSQNQPNEETLKPIRKAKNKNL